MKKTLIEIIQLTRRPTSKCKKTNIITITITITKNGGRLEHYPNPRSGRTGRFLTICEKSEVGVVRISGWISFQGTGTIIEKVCYLGTAKLHFLIDTPRECPHL